MVNDITTQCKENAVMEIQKVGHSTGQITRLQQRTTEEVRGKGIIN